MLEREQQGVPPELLTIQERLRRKAWFGASQKGRMPTKEERFKKRLEDIFKPSASVRLETTADKEQLKEILKKAQVVLAFVQTHGEPQTESLSISEFMGGDYTVEDLLSRDEIPVITELGLGDDLFWLTVGQLSDDLVSTSTSFNLTFVPEGVGEGFLYLNLSGGTFSLNFAFSDKSSLGLLEYNSGLEYIGDMSPEEARIIDFYLDRFIKRVVDKPPESQSG